MPFPEAVKVPSQRKQGVIFVHGVCSFLVMLAFSCLTDPLFAKCGLEWSCELAAEQERESSLKSGNQSDPGSALWGAGSLGRLGESQW